MQHLPASRGDRIKYERRGKHAMRLAIEIAGTPSTGGQAVAVGLGSHSHLDGLKRFGVLSNGADVRTIRSHIEAAFVQCATDVVLQTLSALTWSALPSFRSHPPHTGDTPDCDCDKVASVGIDFVMSDI